MLPSISRAHFCPPRREQRWRRTDHKHKHKHAWERACTRLWLGSPLCVFLFRQRLCETEETQWSACASGCVRASAVHRPYCRWLVLFSGWKTGGEGEGKSWGFPASVPLHTYGKGWKWQLRVGLWIRKVTKGLWLWHRWIAHSAVFSLLRLWTENEHLRVSIKR